MAAFSFPSVVPQERICLEQLRANGGPHPNGLQQCVHRADVQALPSEELEGSKIDSRFDLCTRDCHRRGRVLSYFASSTSAPAISRMISVITAFAALSCSPASSCTTRICSN